MAPVSPDPDAVLDYIEFVAARHHVWEARRAGLPQPWTHNPIVASRKFTNVFRVLDYGSQYVNTLIDPELDPRDQLLRLFLYRHTGRVDAWEYLELASGFPTRANLPEVLGALKQYRGAASERSVFTSAYLVFPQSHTKGTDKVESILDLTDRLFNKEGVADAFLAAPDQASRFATLRRNKGVGDFMSMQILTDWGYTPHVNEDRENEFVVAGPGAKRGAAALARGNPLDVIRWAQQLVHGLDNPPTIDLPDGRVRHPSLMDIQNTLCEFSKYVRYQGKPPAAKPYKPSHPGPAPEPWLPASW